jgi:hypothetical protein
MEVLSGHYDRHKCSLTSFMDRNCRTVVSVDEPRVFSKSYGDYRRGPACENFKFEMVQKALFRALYYLHEE